ncbi:MAG TPA: c-type cytochrome [Acidimicrobiales bacterium]|nr:c-type cytochrome [Acidimicrobiales bacterium]
MITDRNRRRLAAPLALAALGMLAFALLFTAGGSAHGQQNLVSTNPADIAAGQQLFNAHCESCHGYQGRGGQTGAPALVSVGAAAADFYLTTGRMPLNNPANQALRHHPYFDETQIRQLDAYIAALPVITGTYVQGPSIPTVSPLCTTSTPNPKQPGCVTLSQGQQLFAINCAQCHQAAGSGGMLSKGNVVPSLHNANITQVAEAMRVGPKPMPVFGPNVVDQQQMSAIAQYVQYLHKPANPGGLGISHFGPVAEGFVAILVGGVLLLFAARMIGTRG